MIAIIFWTSIFLIIYAYFGYPALVWFFAKFKRKESKKEFYEPSVTLLIAAYNESAAIGKKIENALELDYPREKFQILITNDGSEDGTGEIVRSYADRGVEMVSGEKRQGKMMALKRGMKAARGEIIMMSDATNTYSLNTVKALVEPFVDPSVGIASGAKLVPKGDGVLGSSEGLYWKYESWIKKEETKLGSCINVTGEIYAFRKPLFGSPPDSIINDDFYMMMNVLKQGYRVVYTPDAQSWERVSQTATDEIERRARINAGRYQAMVMASKYLPFDRPLVVWQVISHKFSRPLVPFGMILAFITNFLALIFPVQEGSGFFLLSPPWNKIFFGLQIAFYLLALVGRYINKGLIGKILYLPTFLVNSNWAALKGFWRFASRRQTTLWERVQRREEADG
ncbi:MAG: glycosyltransferase family 2 protein [Chloroflexi bacterium]|nr:glycosyltransferase family 2 protein [Chloroflexota bacterium]